MAELPARDSNMEAPKRDFSRAKASVLLPSLLATVLDSQHHGGLSDLNTSCKHCLA
jgi:hypothetical protein